VVKQPMAGWIGFAAVVMLIVGMLDFFEGLIAVIRGQYYVIHGNQLIVFDTTTWGWITMLWGVVLVLTGFALWSGSGWARWLTIVVVALNIIAQLGWLGASAYPLWSLVIITLNIIVLYALTARWEGYPDRAEI
jgi:C4-dicarboxylate transporter